MCLFGDLMFIAYKYSDILKCTIHDFPACALFSHTIVKMSGGTFCRVEVHIHYNNMNFPILYNKFQNVILYMRCSTIVYVGHLNMFEFEIITKGRLISLLTRAGNDYSRQHFDPHVHLRFSRW